MTYWDHQTKFDVALSLTMTAFLWVAPTIGLPAIFSISPGEGGEITRTWLGPILTLLAMTFATMAFIFTVIDRPEFNIIRGKHSESQLWRIFAQNVAWLTISALYCAFYTFSKFAESFYLFYYIGSFLIIMMSVSIVKYAWVMRQVLLVRIEQTHKK